MSPGPINRRRVLGVLGAGAAAVAVAGRASGRGRPAAAGETGRALGEPAVLASHDGVLDVVLTAAPGVRLAGRDTAALGYNATSPGPTLRVRPGDLLRIRLVNGLDQPTNLHTHGLHVSPQPGADDPFGTVAPGDAFHYAYRIPPEHPAGTFWYHPHAHGHVADQVFGGLVGALLVASAPELDVAADRVLLVTDITLDDAGHVAAPGPMDTMMGRRGELVLVNGQHQPVLPGVPQTAQRWRIINGCASRTLSVGLQGHQLTQLAQDGVFLPAPQPRDRVMVAPAARADVAARPTQAGTFALITDPEPSTPMMSGMGAMGSSGGGMVTLATLVATGPAAASPALPTALPAPHRPPGRSPASVSSRWPCP